MKKLLIGTNIADDAIDLKNEESNMTQWKCPLCGKTECINEPNNAVISFDCNTYKRSLVPCTFAK